MFTSALGTPITDNDRYGIKAFIEKHDDIENIRFFALMNPVSTAIPFMGICLTDDNKFGWALCKIDETRYKIEDGYKITLRSIDPHYSYEHYYQSDFNSSIERGFIIPALKNEKGETPYIEHFIGREEVAPNAYVQHEFDYIAYRKEVS